MGVFSSYLSEKKQNGAGQPLTQAVSQPAAGTSDGTPESGQFKDYLTSKQMTSEPVAPTPTLMDQAVEAYVPNAEVYGQGAGLGYGAQLNAGMQAGMGAVDQLVNGQNNFGDQSKPDANLFERAVDAVSNAPENYSLAKKGVLNQIDSARSAHPVASALSEIAGSIAPSYLGGAAMKGATTMGKAAGIGGLYSYGSSRKEGLDRLDDAALGAGLSAGFSQAIPAGKAIVSSLKNIPGEEVLMKEMFDYGKPIISIAKAEVEKTPYGLSFKPKMSEAFQLGKQMQNVLTDPDVQAQITREFNDQPEVIQGIIKSTKTRLSDLWKPIIAEHGHVTTEADPILNRAYETAKDVAVKGDEVAEKLQGALFDKINGLAEGFKPADGIAGTGGSASLQQLTEAQEALGTAIFTHKQFDKAPGVKAAAIRIWGQLKDATTALDKAKGSGGQLKPINDVYHAMYSMEDNMLKGANIRAMVNPQNVGADNKFAQFVKPFEKLPPNVRQELAPEMHSYLAEAFPKVFAKAKTMVAATLNKTGASIEKLFSLRGLQAARMGLANRAGQLSNISYNGPGIPTGVIEGALPVAAPSIANQIRPGQ